MATGIKISHQTIDKSGKIIEIYQDGTGTKQLEPEELMEKMIERRKRHRNLFSGDNKSVDESLPIK